MASSVASIVAKQDELLGLISRAMTNFKKLETKKRTATQAQTRLDNLAANWKKYQTNHEQLSQLKPDERSELPYFKDNCYEVCEEAYIGVKSDLIDALNELLPRGSTSSTVHASNPVTKSAPISRQLPRLNLPHFSGSYSEWRHFRDLFTSMVGENIEISDVERMQYLKISVKNEAAQVIKNYSITGEEFARAWQALVTRYENKRVLIDTHLAALFSVRQVTHQSAIELKSLLGNVQEAIGALKALGSPTEHWDHILVFMVARKLDPASLTDWEKQIGANTDPARFSDLENFLTAQIRAFEGVERASGSNKPRQNASAGGKVNQSAKSHQAVAAAIATDSPSDPQKSSTTECAHCKGTHYISSCTEFRNKTLEQRREIVNQKGLCYNCLGPHQYRNCRTSKRCQVCGNPHHTLLHRSTDSTSREANSNVQKKSVTATSPDSVVSNAPNALALPRRDDPTPLPSVSSNSALAMNTKYTPVLLATALVNVASRYGELIEVRALLDQGSEVSFITESLARRLNQPRRRVSLPISGIGAKKSSLSKEVMTIEMSSRIAPPFTLSVNAYVLAKLTSYLPPIRVFETDWPHLHDLDLADPAFTSSKEIDLVLGVEVYSRILEEGLRKGSLNSPVAQKTTLGWILSGSVSPQLHSDTDTRVAHGLQCSVDHDLLDLLQRFWVQEETTTGAKSSFLEEEAHCEQHFVETHSRTSDGRYVVRLPFKRLPENLGDSRKPALNMLMRQEKRFSSNSTLKSAYYTFLAEYENLGHMTRAPESSEHPHREFYLPHHAVVRESSSTTKVRVVFNGSQRTNFGFSINDLLHVGPKLQTDLADVITLWRRHAYVFSADIEKMYRQIRVHSEDWDFQRILWRNNSDEPVSPFHLCTVTYGLASAPYLAIRALRQLAIDEEHRYPLAKCIIDREIYVDDVLSGADTVADAQNKIREISSCLAAGGFVLQKWASNDETLLKDIPLERKEHSTSLSLDNEPLFRALGLLWQPRSDAFAFSTRGFECRVPVTKRTVLSRIAQMFDPLGWIAPVVVRGKLFMQELWTIGLDWDDPLPEEFILRWTKFVEDLEAISSISVPRWLGLRSSSLAVELHGFSDASQAALGAVIYLRVIDDLDDARVTLVSAKTKVAPLKTVTIPRLELSAAVLLVRQIAHIRTVLDLDDAYVHLWTDSTVALAYIQGEPSRWAEYVRNRVTEIKELPRSRWHHVPGKENPADFASRGLSPRELNDKPSWWHGPSWLARHSTAWPSSVPPPDSDVALEIRKTTVNLVNQENLPHVQSLVKRYSTLTRLLRVTAWFFRAVKKFRREQNVPGSDQPLTPAELDTARLFWVKTTQETFFETEISRLSSGQQLSRSSPLVRLTPYVDASGLLRVGGRLRHALIDNDEKHPLILPRDSSLTTLIIDNCHRRTLHGGTQVTLATIRRRFWILGGRLPVRSHIHRCLSCVRHRAALGTQLMGQLPESRVRPARPFANSGVDYAGPFTLRTFRGRGAKTYKGYLVVFVCMSSSAVHLELATDYTTDGFLAAYQRFTSRRGICTTLTSDCGTNLIGADAELRKLFHASTKEFAALANILANDGTQWKFNPPSAPHFGGKWEAAVKSAKFHIKRVVGDTGLTYEEFSTLLSQVESVLNSRPICALSDDPSDMSALTPGHFLIGSALNTIPEPSLADLPRSRLSRWQMLRQMLEHFWQRWSIEYLRGLQTVPKWQHRTDSIKIGSLVLINDDRYPPSKWPLGRVIDVHPGKDNLVRVATVRTQHSTYKRPIVKLCVLPVSSDEDDSSARDLNG